MIHKVKPELTLYLAEEALKRKYEKPQVNLKEMLELQQECRDYLSGTNMKKIFLINNIIQNEVNLILQPIKTLSNNYQCLCCINCVKKIFLKEPKYQIW